MTTPTQATGRLKGRPTGIDLIDLAPAPAFFSDEVTAGLSQPQKSIPSKFFYDENGSRLFEEICRLPEYYPPRAELAILAAHARDIAALAGPFCHVIELGSGASVKIGYLLDALDRPARYMPIDISRAHLLAGAENVAARFPGLAVVAVCADYMAPMTLPLPKAERRLGFFPGSTIGNLTPDEARRFLWRLSRILGTGGALVIGVDTRKDRRVLHAAYNDARGVTAAFNLNLLARINAELEGTFDLDGFEHRAFYNGDLRRIEMHLVSRREQKASAARRQFQFLAGETIHTENSYKYAPEDFRTLAEEAGFAPVAVWQDSDKLFSVHYLQVA